MKIRCETCAWRESEIGYFSPCPSYAKEMPFLKEQAFEKWRQSELAELEEQDLDIQDH